MTGIARWRQSAKQLADRIDAWSLRERALVFVGILVVPIVIAMNFLFVPLRSEQLRLEKQIAGRLGQTRDLNTEGDALLASRMQHPDVIAHAQIEQLQRQLRANRGTLSVITHGLVSPKEMARLVREMLAKNGGLQLVSIENLPPLPLGGSGPGSKGKTDLAPSSAKANPADASAPPVVYLHGMRVVLKGRYVDIVRYLQSLEALHWKMFWGNLNLKAQHYPVSEVTLVIYTLGFNRAWIGM
ncbi:MAG: hypothetical protein ACYDB8_04470 [Acidiferrobacterales bacterium]